MTHYKQLTYAQRCQIEALKKSGLSQNKMADIIGVNQSTISRELRRNRGLRGYRHKQAQRLAAERRHSANKAYKMTPELVRLIEDKLCEEQWSPDQISGWLKKQGETTISHERIYLHIWANKRAGGNLWENLRRQHKPYDKRRNGKSTRGVIRNRIGIENRPDIVDKKTRVGDWEFDTVIGCHHQGALVTLVERKTKFTLVGLVEHKTADAVTKEIVRLLTPYKHLVHTMTADNGKEFAYHEVIAKKLAADFYFARPYHSWERGLNENTNGLLRQYFPKCTNLRKMDYEEVVQTMDKLNRRPRKTLGYATPHDLMQNSLMATGVA